jgi:hypothetical protein
MRKRYLQWIDADLGTGWPRMNGLSPLDPFLPLVIGLGYALKFHPHDKPGLVESVLLIAPTVVLFTVWGWRVCLAAKRQLGDIRRSRKSD